MRLKFQDTLLLKTFKGPISLKSSQETDFDYISFTAKQRNTNKSGKPTDFTNHKLNFKHNDFKIAAINIQTFKKKDI